MRSRPSESLSRLPILGRLWGWVLNPVYTPTEAAMRCPTSAASLPSTLSTPPGGPGTPSYLSHRHNSRLKTLKRECSYSRRRCTRPHGAPSSTRARPTPWAYQNQSGSGQTSTSPPRLPRPRAVPCPPVGSVTLLKAPSSRRDLCVASSQSSVTSMAQWRPQRITPGPAEARPSTGLYAWPSAAQSPAERAPRESWRCHGMSARRGEN